MDIEPRRRQPFYQPDPKWYDDPFSVIGVAVAVFAVCAVAVLVYQHYQRQAVAAELRQLSQQMHTNLQRSERQLQNTVYSTIRAATPQVRTVRQFVPPRSLEACKAQAAGVIDERFAKCRSGYWLEEQVEVSR